MISREISPPPLSDDSAVGSMASCNGFSHQNGSGPYQASPSQSYQSTHPYLGPSSSRSVPSYPQSQSLPNSQPPQNRPNQQAFHQKDQNVNNVSVHGLVHKSELINAATRMRYNNTTLTSRSIRTHLACFDDLDLQKFTKHSDYMINFISIGSNKCPSYIQRPLSILWPSFYDHMVEELAELDAYLINTEFLEKPIDWMLQRNLTTVPLCNQCKCDMILKYENDTAKWVCNRTQPCLNSYTSLHRPGFFKDYESIGLTKILFAIYYWSTSTQLEYIKSRLRLDRLVLYGIWKRIQNVCRAALENLPYQLTSHIDKTRTTDAPINCAPVDLISIKFNRNYIVCAKHPMFNQVKLGLYIPNHSTYSFADLTSSWFSQGTKIRVCESKFLELSQKRSDLIIDMTTRVQMMNKPDGTFNRTSAFGYLICQLTSTFKDFDSSSVSNETLKLVLAEMQWRELYGTTPYYAFTNIIQHIAKYEKFAESYTEILPKDTKQVSDVSDVCDDGFVYAEKYFYAEVFPVDKYGKIIRSWGKSLEGLPQPVAQFYCHICSNSYESFYFSMHIIAHVENIRKENDTRLYKGKKLIECKHCFKPFNREELLDHSALLRLHYHKMKFGCRICYIKFNDRTSYLKHMRRIHFQHETPYRCPSCKYATSFQRELFIHFQEAHRNSFILMCPFCLKSFTIKDPQKLTPEVMRLVSLTIYNHFVDHYVKANCYSCSNCCLTFLSKNSLRRHKARHHNPLEIRITADTLLQEFVILSEEEQFCVKAMPMELFIANKRPNIKIGEALQVFSESHLFTEETDEDEEMTSDESDSESSGERATIHVRDPQKANEFLVGGKAAIHIPKKTKVTPDDELTSEKIIELFGRKAKVDKIIPNQSILLAPNGEPARCLECNEYLAVDHCVAEIDCKKCAFKTHCPRAAVRHRESDLHDRLGGAQYKLKTLKAKYSSKSDLS